MESNVDVVTPLMSLTTVCCSRGRGCIPTLFSRSREESSY